MILSSSFIDCLFYIFLIGYQFGITNGSSNTSTSHSSIDTTTTPIIISTTTTTIAAAPPSNPSVATPTIKVPILTTAISGQTVITVSNGTGIPTNGTVSTTGTKSSLPLILGLVFGSLAFIILVASIVIYILMQQGHIKMFDSPRTRISKDNERSRLGDSSSSIGAGSPSRR